MLYNHSTLEEEEPHPASSTYTYQSRRGAVAYPSCHRAKGRVQSYAGQRDIQRFALTFTPLESQINRTQTCRENIRLRPWTDTGVEVRTFLL